MIPLQSTNYDIIRELNSGGLNQIGGLSWGSLNNVFNLIMALKGDVYTLSTSGSLLPGGVTGNVQFNNGGSFAGVSNGTSGQLLQSRGALAPIWVDAPTSGWSLTGNSGTNSLTNFAGTTDDVDFVLKSNNVSLVVLTASPSVGVIIGDESSPSVGNWSGGEIQLGDVYGNGFSTQVIIDDLAAVVNIEAGGTAGVFNGVNVGSWGGSVLVSAPSLVGTIGATTIGDYYGSGNNTQVLILDTDRSVVIGDAVTSVADIFVDGFHGVTTVGDVFLNGNGTNIKINDTGYGASIYSTIGASGFQMTQILTTIGDFQGNVNGTNIQINDSSQAVTVSNNSQFSTPNIVGNSTTPFTSSLGVSITGTSVGGLITLNTSTGASTGMVVSATYPLSGVYPNGSYIVLTPANAATALLSGASMVYANGTTTGFTITAGSTPLTLPTIYQWNYIIVGN